MYSDLITHTTSYLIIQQRPVTYVYDTFNPVTCSHHIMFYMCYNIVLQQYLVTHTTKCLIIHKSNTYKHLNTQPHNTIQYSLVTYTTV